MARITGLKWRHVRLQDCELVLPKGEHKTGGKTGKPRVISLPATAAAIIARQSGGALDDFVFPSSTGAQLVSLKKSWRTIRVEAELPEGMGLHGLRHSLATMMAIGAAGGAQIMEVLGHAQLSTTNRYLNLAEARRGIIEKHTAGISAALEGKPTGKVERLRNE